MGEGGETPDTQAKKVTETGAGRLRECKNTEFVSDLSEPGFCEGGRKYRVYVYESVRSLGGLPLYSEASHERNLGTSRPGFPKKILEYRPYCLF